VSHSDKRRILVVDDEQRVRQAVQRVLGEAGYEIFLAEDGQQGLDLVDQHAPDLVLVDLMMPVMDGMEFLDQARRRYPDLTSVVITGFATLDKAVEAMKQGADDFLAKPFKPRELKLVVERALKRAATLQDISTEKSRNRALVNAMSNGVLVVNPRGEAVMANPALLRLLGRDQEQIEGQPSRTVLPWPEVSDCLTAVISGGELPPEKARCQCSQGQDDEALHLQVCCAPFHDARGEVTGAVAVFDDVTAWHRLDQYKNEFVTTVAHDIVSPLAAVQAQLQNLAQGLLGPLQEEQKPLVKRARERLQGVANLSRDLLDLSKIEAGVMGQPQRLDLEPILREAMDMLQGQAEQKQQSLHLEIAPELPQVMGVGEELMEVVLNLVGNAVKYTQNEGEVILRVFRDGDRVVMEVHDNGPGIPPEEQEAVFKRFHRVINPENRHITGTGLGLAIVKRVVENHQGRLELDSNPGSGSCFRVSLPAC
jgi:two-component system, OmpR family, phosphate regulon sensor histidine kinase PhoR